jgi:hypothetical protein
MSNNIVTLEVDGLKELQEQAKKITEIANQLQKEIEIFNNIKITFVNEK